MTLIMI